MSFYRTDLPWQSHWQSLRSGGEAVVVRENGRAVGYALFRKTYYEDGRVKDILMYHYGVDPSIKHKENVARFALYHVFNADYPIQRCVSLNTPVSDDCLNQILEKSGFTPRKEQVYMMAEL